MTGHQGHPQLDSSSPPGVLSLWPSAPASSTTSCSSLLAVCAMDMPGPSLGAGEEVLITAHAVHKKLSGTAWFTTRRALWRADDGKAAVQRVEVPWAAVKSFQVCATHVARCVLLCVAV